LADCLPGAEADAACQRRLQEATERAPNERQAIEGAIRHLDGQLQRARQLYEFGEYEWDAFLAKRTEIQDEQTRLRERLETRQGPADAEWCRSQVVDPLAAWNAAEDDHERGQLLTSVFERIEAHGSPKGTLRLVGVPRAGWRPFFVNVVAQRETRLELATSSLEV
jgi:hypothetical protein